MERTVKSLRLSFFLMMVWGGIVIPRIPNIKDHFQLTVPQLGKVLMVAGLSAIFLAKPVATTVKRLGSRQSIFLALPLGFLGNSLIGFQISIPIFILAYFLNVFAFLLVNTAINIQATNLKSITGKDYLSGFTAYANIGSLSGIGVGALLLRSLSTTQYILGMTSFVTIAFVFAGLGLKSQDQKEEEHHSKLPWFGKAVIPIYVVIMAMFAQGLAEFSVSDWGAILGKEEFHIKAPFYLSLYIFFQIGIILSRFLLNRFGERFGLNNFVFFSGLITALIWAASILGAKTLSDTSPTTTIFLSALGFFIGGFGVGPFWPAFLSRITSYGFPIPAVFARAMAILSFGFVFGPGMIGFVAKSVGLTHAMLFPVVMMVITAISAKKLLPPKGLK